MTYDYELSELEEVDDSLGPYPPETDRYKVSEEGKYTIIRDTEEGSWIKTEDDYVSLESIR